MHCKHYKKLANLTRKKVTQFEDFNVPLNQNNITNSFFVHLKSCLLDFPKHLYFQDITKLQNCLHSTFLPVPVHDHHFSVSLYFFIFHTLLSNKKIKPILNVDVKIDYEILQLENLIFKS